jgi:hypothetical protein
MAHISDTVHELSSDTSQLHVDENTRSRDVSDIAGILGESSLLNGTTSILPVSQSGVDMSSLDELSHDTSGSSVQDPTLPRIPNISDTVQELTLDSILPSGKAVSSHDRIPAPVVERPHHSEGSSLEIGPSTPSAHSALDMSSLEELSQENSRLEKSVDVYRKNLNLLESKVKALEAELRTGVPAGTLQYPEVSEEDWVNKIVDLEEQLKDQKAKTEAAEARLKSKDQEMTDVLLSTAAGTSESRDKLIKALQEQIHIRDEEIEFYKVQRLGNVAEQRKVEKLLMSGIHALSLRYHEEMVSRTVNNSDDFFSEEYKRES